MISATQCRDQLIGLLEKVEIASKPGVKLLEKKVVTANTTAGLVEKVKLAKKPCVGILYEGARRNDNGQAGKQLGLNAELVFALVVVTEESVISQKVDVATPTDELLDGMRKVLMGVRSPTSHYWQWQIEAKADEKGGNTLWVQRWTTARPMAPSGIVG